MLTQPLIGRRQFLYGSLALGSTFLYKPGAFAEELAKTPRSTEGPFYPDKLPLDTDNDLLVINDKITPAVGEITHLYGKITDTAGKPIPGIVIEIWQVDGNGAYLHSGTGNKAKQDKNFQGFGRFAPGKNGEYYFRTVKPVVYPGRAPHIHFKVKKGNKELLTSQIMVAGGEGLETDGVYRGVDAKSRTLLVAEFKPMKDSKIGELEASFNIVVGAIPSENPREPKKK